MKQFNNSTKKQGFSIVELLLVIGIFGILITLVLVNYKRVGIKTDAEYQAQKFASVLKQAQMMALTGEEINGSRPPAYGVHILDPKTYILFSDEDGTETRSAGDKDIQTFDLPANIKLDSSGTDIIFKPPIAAITILGVSGQKIVIFSYESQSEQVVIDVRTGQIDVQ